MRCGPTRFSDEGAQLPIGWNDVYYFSLCTGHLEEPWEREFVFDLGQAYAAGLFDGRNALNSIPPMDREDEE